MSESNTDENKEENNYIDSDEEYGLFNQKETISCNGKRCPKRRETIYIDGKQFKFKKKKLIRKHLDYKSKIIQRMNLKKIKEITRVKLCKA